MLLQFVCQSYFAYLQNTQLLLLLLLLLFMLVFCFCFLFTKIHVNLITWKSLNINHLADTLNPFSHISKAPKIESLRL